MENLGYLTIGLTIGMYFVNWFKSREIKKLEKELYEVRRDATKIENELNELKRT